MAEPETVDVRVQNEGTIFLFFLETPAAQLWVEDHVASEPWQHFGGALAVEHRFAKNLAEGMANDGLVVR